MFKKMKTRRMINLSKYPVIDPESELAKALDSDSEPWVCKICHNSAFPCRCITDRLYDCLDPEVLGDNELFRIEVEVPRRTVWQRVKSFFTMDV